MRYFLCVLCLLVISLNCIAQTVQLKQERVAYAPKSFYIGDVKDDRADKWSMGTIIGDGKRENIGFQNEAASALYTFIEKNVTQSKSTQATSLHISKLDFDAKKRGGVWTVNAEAILTFYVGDKKILEYTSRGEGQTDAAPESFVEGFIRQAINSDLKKFDEWWMNNKGSIPVAETVKVNVKMATTTDKPNTIVYSLQPLKINDFNGRPDGAEYEMAVTVSGIGVGYSASTQNSQVVLEVTVTAYFNKAQSWFKPEGKNARVLAHEQTHFDITAVKACELITAIRNTAFTQENYVKLLEELQTKNAKDANDEEVLYDKETNHGTIAPTQAEWERKITEQVRAIGCF